METIARARGWLRFAVLAAVALFITLGTPPDDSARALPANDIADVVFGQDGNFTTSACNPVSASSLCFSVGVGGTGDVATDNAGNVYVADYFNNRVLEYDAPLTTDTVADRVFGQGGSFASATCNNGGIGASSLCSPSGLALDAAGNLYVADSGNNRVLVFNAPLTTDTVADTVFGQGGSFITNACGAADASALCFVTPETADVAVDSGGNVYVVERHRVLEYDTPLATDTVADRVFGQGGVFTTINCNKGGISADSLCFPSGLALDGAGNLYVADANNNRGLKYDAPLTTDTTADAVIGQVTFTFGTCNPGGVTATSLCLSAFVRGRIAADAAGHVFIADYSNFRVLEYEPPLAAAADAADRVYGQGGSFATQLCGAGADHLCYPAALALSPAGDLHVVDSFNNRVLTYRDALRTGVPADAIFGQLGNFTTGLCNNNGIPSASSLCLAAGGSVAVDGAGNVYVSDTNSHRVLEYDTPLTTDTVADRVFGQGGSFTSVTCANGGVSASSLCNPGGIALDSAGNLYAVDASYNRVLEYDTPLTTDTVADRVFGQAGMTTGSCNAGGVSATTLCFNLGGRGDVAVDGAGNLFIADYWNSRVLEYDTPLTTDTTADRVYGQAGNLANDVCNLGGLSASTLCNPTGLALDGAGNLYVTDAGNNRALEYDAPLADAVADRVFGQGGSFLTATCNSGGLSAASLCLRAGSEHRGTIAVDGAGNVFIADRYNTRVLEYDTPLTAGVVADRVYGQVAQDYGRARCNDGGVSRSSLCNPYGVEVATDGSLFVVDSGNNRVLAFVAGADTDGDGCSDVEEFGLLPLDGGTRDPDSPWDFYDVNGSKKVDALDINLVRSKFNGVGPTPPGDRIYDRSVGAYPWAPGPPNNKINAIDVNLVRAEFNHSCLPAP